MMKALSKALVVSLSFMSLTMADQFNLDSAKKELVKENINVAIAYENYVLVKEQAHTKTMQLLPTLSVDLLVTDYQYTILRSVIPEPSRFFDAFAAKDLARAADANKAIVKKNLLEDLEKTYFLYQFHKEVIADLKYELKTRNELLERSKEAYDLGAIKFEEFYATQRAQVQAKANLVNAEEVLKLDELSLKLILQEDNLSDITLDEVAFYNGELNFPSDINVATQIALDNSKEIEQWDHLIAAARDTKKGVSISWLSWNGVGFDYFSRVRVAKSEITKLELQRKKTVIELKNQIALQYAQIEKQKEKISYQAELTEMGVNEYERSLEDYNNQLATVVTVKRAELSMLQSKRDLRRLNYELEIKYLKLKRLIGSNMITNEIPRQ